MSLGIEVGELRFFLTSVSSLGYYESFKQGCVRCKSPDVFKVD